jgi:hypothetical protein
MEITKIIYKLLISQLPNKLELCHDNIMHHKVQKDKFEYRRIIPKGNKCFLWLKRDTKNNLFSYLLFIQNNKIKKIKQFNVCFHKFLTTGKYGTLLFGSYFSIKNMNLFTIEDIVYYKNEYMFNNKWNNKFIVINEILTHYIKQIYYTKFDLLVGSVLTIKKDKDIDEFLYNIPYEIYGIQYINNNTSYIDKNINFKTKILNVKAKIQNDIYECFDNNNNSLGTLHIPDYKTSVKMNNIFRKIRENVDLDYLEESDDEEDFENINQDKFVYLNKCVKCKCVYNKKFKLWCPIEIL